jgi:uncharacterized protein (TIGR02145 family)
LGTSYGQQVSFKTLLTDPPTVSDIDGNVYNIVTIGTQVWMAENLKVTKYNDGVAIPNINNGYNWGYMVTPAYCWYNDDIANKNIYGALYNWYTVNSKKICPQGWHIPSNYEWTELTNYLGGLSASAIKLKEAGNLHWFTSNNIATNESKFTALPGGYRRYYDGAFFDMGSNCSFWSSTTNNDQEAWSRAITLSNSSVQVVSNMKNYGISVRCIKNTLPSISTNSPSSVFSTTVNCGGNVIGDGGEAVTEYGVCWSTSETPTIADTKKLIGNGIGTFTATITGLAINTTYYVRAYATNSLGTSYGQQVSFKTLLTDPPTVTDIDGNVYNTVTIGTQTWMVENLKTTKYNDGSTIPLITESYQWTVLSTPGYCWPNNDINNKAIYGAMYNFYAGSTGKLAPIGWHVPCKSEIETLITYLGGTNVAGSKLKETGNLHWTTGNTDATNNSGFTAVPGAYRSSSTGSFMQFGATGVWWTTTELSGTTSYHLGLESTTTVAGVNTNPKLLGCNVRCLKNSLASLSTTTPTGIMSTTATCGGIVTADGGETVTESGICWNNASTPTIANSKKTFGAGISSFSTSITGLTPNTTYYVRAYATNSLGTAYGQQVTLKTLATDPITVIDVDGNLYHTVTIGNQTWMVENMKTTKYRNGDVIGTTSSINMDLTYATNPKYQWAYNANESNVSNYGRLYTWHAVADSRNLAPEGWHVASVEEWTILQNFLISNGYNYDKTTVSDKIAKSLCSTTLWNTNSNVGTPSCDLTQNNASGFSSVPSGYRGFDGMYYLMGNACYYWTTTEYSLDNAEIRYMGINNVNLLMTNSNKNYGYSVRCVKNN